MVWPLPIVKVQISVNASPRFTAVAISFQIHLLDPIRGGDSLEHVIGIFQSYVSVPGLLLLFAGTALISKGAKFRFPYIALYLGLLLAGLGLVSLHCMRP